jgi:hypothetical protein
MINNFGGEKSPNSKHNRIKKKKKKGALLNIRIKIKINCPSELAQLVGTLHNLCSGGV